MALARRKMRPGKKIQVGELSIDTETRRAKRGAVELRLTPTGMRLLELLLRRSPAVVSRGEMERVIWGGDLPESDALRVHLHALRTAVDGSFERKLIRNVRGAGYAVGDDDLP